MIKVEGNIQIFKNIQNASQIKMKIPTISQKTFKVGDKEIEFTQYKNYSEILEELKK